MFLPGRMCNLFRICLPNYILGEFLTKPLYLRDVSAPVTASATTTMSSDDNSVVGSVPEHASVCCKEEKAQEHTTEYEVLVKKAHDIVCLLGAELRELQVEKSLNQFAYVLGRFRKPTIEV